MIAVVVDVLDDPQDVPELHAKDDPGDDAKDDGADDENGGCPQGGSGKGVLAEFDLALSLQGRRENTKHQQKYIVKHFTLQTERLAVIKAWLE